MSELSDYAGSFRSFFIKDKERADFKTHKCPKCKRGILDILHDDTGMYFKCKKCGYEYPE